MLTDLSAVSRFVDSSLTLLRTVGAMALVVAVVSAQLVPSVTVAGPARSNPVHLLSNPLQPAIDQLLDAQQQIDDTNSEYPFVTPADLGPLLHGYTHNLALTML